MVLRALLVLAVVTVAGVYVVRSVGGPARIAEPAPSHSCGFYYNRNTPVSGTQRRVNACIVKAAREGRRARAVAALTTIEGDPIVIYVFVRGRRNILVLYDSTKDDFGERGWTRSRCNRLVVSESFLGSQGCVEIGVGKPSWLEPFELPD
jgi:hypothetical protein